MANTVGSDPREKVAQRLLGGSVKRSYDPDVDMDWDAPLDPDKFFLPAEVLSLYGTPMWQRMTHQQRQELSRQELANVLSVGIWFENILNRMLLRDLIDEDPTSKHAHYTLTEMGDECRHMVMFGRVIDRVGAKPYWPKGLDALFVKALPFFLRRSMVWTGALLGEEIFDALQRRIMANPDLQPLVARLMRIHVTEEARHIRFAREAIARDAGTLPAWERRYTQTLTAIAAPLFADMFTNRHMYRRAGLDAREAKREAMANPHFRQARETGAASLAEFLDDVGLMGRHTKASWRRWGFLA
ncbi:AurF N-oxygenase family protein [Haloechinothrix halophila]|uniref:AurF N-oxygenase family protein n=1 Tax=Haloechinothrix halophila TaxID=1069073 RepID=UPI0003F79AC8|nr:diiron oxygenase [Haloechinothrix halophila]